MLALCVKMQYSISRWRHQQPQPPFEIAGIYSRVDGRDFVMDAVEMIELVGGPVSADLKTGDLISFRALQAHAGSKSSNRGFHFHFENLQKISQQEAEWNPRVGSKALEFAEFTETVRRYFLNQGLKEIFTPSLVPCPGLEPSLEPFSSERRRGSRVEKTYLPTSPEIHLKKALALGFTDIFEIKPCFRNNENSPHHAEEFLMLEWYRSFADLKIIKDDLKALLLALHDKIQNSVQIQETEFSILFREVLDFPLTPQSSREDLARVCARLNIEFTGGDSFNDLFHRLMIEKIEPALLLKGPTIVQNFPPSMAALAKLTDDGWADRFEFYWNGFEIANAFNEVTNANEQAARWQIEKDERTRLGTSELPDDPELIQALKRGLPPTGGIALGVERLFMAMHGISDIRELRVSILK